MSANTILESLYYVASVLWILYMVGSDLWERHKAKDDEGRKKKGQR